MVHIGDKIKIEAVVSEYNETKNIVKLNLKINGEKENGEKMDDGQPTRQLNYRA